MSDLQGVSGHRKFKALEERTRSLFPLQGFVGVGGTNFEASASNFLPTTGKHLQGSQVFLGTRVPSLLPYGNDNRVVFGHIMV